MRFTCVVTGGIATGKSTFIAKLLSQRPDIGLFDCDKAVHQLLTEAETKERLTELFGHQILTSDGRALDRSKLRHLIFRQDAARRALENLLHPLVAQRSVAEQERFFEDHPHGVFAVDVPLYYESRSNYPNELVVVVATTSGTQKRRLIHRSALDEATADAIIAAQLPIALKVTQADVVIWNEGPLALLDEQVGAFLHTLPKS